MLLNSALMNNLSILQVLYNQKCFNNIMQIDYHYLALPVEVKCTQLDMKQHFQFLKKDAGKYAKNVILREMLKILKNLSVVHNGIF